MLLKARERRRGWWDVRTTIPGVPRGAARKDPSAVGVGRCCDSRRAAMAGQMAVLGACGQPRGPGQRWGRQEGGRVRKGAQPGGGGSAGLPALAPVLSRAGPVAGALADLVLALPARSGFSRWPRYGFGAFTCL